MDSDIRHLSELNRYFRTELSKRLTHITFNGDLVKMAPRSVGTSVSREPECILRRSGRRRTACAGCRGGHEQRVGLHQRIP